MKKKLLNKFIYIYILGLLAGHQISAQCYTHTAPVVTKGTNSYTKINLSAQWVSACEVGCTDLRLYDQNTHQYVPYILRQREAEAAKPYEKEWPLNSVQEIKGCCTKVLIDNKTQEPLSQVLLKVKNAEVTKYITVKGSNNKRDWYIIKEKFAASGFNSQQNTFTLFNIRFAPVDYRWQQIEIDDSDGTPLKVQGVVSIEQSLPSGTPFTKPIISELKSSINSKEKENTIYIDFKSRQYIEFIKLDISAPELYKRNARLEYLDSTKNSKSGKFTTVWRPCASMLLHSASGNIFDITPLYAQKLRLVIYNGDDLPLTIGAVSALQHQRHIIAKVIKDHTYELQAGCDEWNAPEYDLTSFSNQISDSLPTIEMGALAYINSSSKEASYTFFTSKYFIWVTLIIVMLLIGRLTYKMLKEMKHQ
jgi:hypothetical protein